MVNVHLWNQIGTNFYCPTLTIHLRYERLLWGGEIRVHPGQKDLGTAGTINNASGYFNEVGISNDLAFAARIFAAPQSPLRTDAKTRFEPFDGKGNHLHPDVQRIER
ncbi:MAG: hypothetical protein HY540_04995 [Deltaproteobacteria bacterium]|nr:hypothetical protein [Deltaproteobacteria bacterium]